MPEPIPPFPTDDTLDADDLADLYGYVQDVTDDAGTDDKAVLAAVLNDPTGAPAGPAAWRPTNDLQAEWCARHRAQALLQLEAVNATYDEWYEQIHAWLKTATRGPALTVAHMEHLLEHYALERRAADEKHGKTTTLPSATVRTVRHRQSVDMVHAGEVLGWALGSVPTIVQKREWVNVTDVRDHVVVFDQHTGRHEIDLACGCSLVDTLPDDTPTDDDGRVWLGELAVLCPEHHTTQTVIACSPESQPIAVDAVSGGPVPGLHVTPEHVTASVGS